MTGCINTINSGCWYKTWKLCLHVYHSKFTSALPYMVFFVVIRKTQFAGEVSWSSYKCHHLMNISATSVYSIDSHSVLMKPFCLPLSCIQY